MLNQFVQFTLFSLIAHCYLLIAHSSSPSFPVSVSIASGKLSEKNLSASEMNKRRLEYARKLDAERYKDERTVPLSELNKQDKE